MQYEAETIHELIRAWKIKHQSLSESKGVRKPSEGVIGLGEISIFHNLYSPSQHQQQNLEVFSQLLEYFWA